VKLLVRLELVEFFVGECVGSMRPETVAIEEDIVERGVPGLTIFCFEEDTFVGMGYLS
jgi:hypothetical protein